MKKPSVILTDYNQLVILSETGQIRLTKDEGYIVLRQLDQKLLELVIRNILRLKQPAKPAYKPRCFCPEWCSLHPDPIGNTD